MRTWLTVVILFLCFCNGMASADNASTKLNGPSAIMILDDDTTDTGVFGGIANVISRLDAWIQKNLW